MKVKEIRQAVEAKKVRSAWMKGVKVYALEMIDEMIESIEGGYVDPETITTRKELETVLLNGADSWKQYSEGGCSLIYDVDIAERLCTPSELKRTDHGTKDPNKDEIWINVQTRALYQAFRMIANIAF